MGREVEVTIGLGLVGVKRERDVDGFGTDL